MRLPWFVLTGWLAGCGGDADPPPAVISAVGTVADTAAVDWSASPLTAPDPDSPSPVPVRHPEGTVHGFLRLVDGAGSELASGALLQVVRDGVVESRMVFHFADSSLHDERVAFRQDDGFRMLRYRLVQRGPAFDIQLDATLDPTGAYRVVSRSGDDEPEQHLGTLDLPDDTYNGMPIIILKNLPPGGSRTVHLVAFTPKPRLVNLHLRDVGGTTVTHGGRTLAARRFELEPDLDGLVGLLADLFGKLPPSSHATIVTDQVPAFVRFEGPLYMGPVWRIELSGPDHPR
jgi:hypothetical protein